jgi:hypothetical protein
MNKVEAYLESDINLDDFDYLVEMTIGPAPELISSEVVIFASNVIADKIIARNGKFASMDGLEPKWQYEGNDIYVLTTPVSLVRKVVDGEEEYRLMTITDGMVVFVRILNSDLKQDLLDQFNIVVPFNPNGIINELSRPC